MVTRIRKWGNSLGVRLPKSAVQESLVRDGAAVEITVRKGEIVVRPLKADKPRLADLLRDVHPENIHSAVDWGTSKGREW